MLVLARRSGESLVIGDDIIITVLGVEGGEVRLGIEAPRSVPVLRQEMVRDVRQQNRRAASNPAGLSALDALRAGLRPLDPKARQTDEGSHGQES